MPDPAAAGGPVAVVLVGAHGAAVEATEAMEHPAVPAVDAPRLRDHAAVVGLASEPWPGVDQDHDEVRAAVAPAPYYAVRSWHRHGAYVERLAAAVVAARNATAPDVHVLFTAPGRPAGADGPVPEDVVFLRETAEAVSAAAGISRRSIAWTSGDLGPSSHAALTALAEAHGRGAVLRCSLDPLGRPDSVPDEARSLGLAFTEVGIARADLPAILDAVVATVVEHERLEGGTP